MSASTRRFQILSLSGGGFRGLFTAKILADIESEINEPIGRRFDLIAGTSIGGILALAVALEIPATEMVELFEKHGESIFRKRSTLLNYLRAKYSTEPLKTLLSADALFGKRLLGECKHPVIVPTINFTQGVPNVFKTPHHPDFKRDHKYLVLDVGLATSAAPLYFARHVFNNCHYVDGGLFANAPGLLGLHEAQRFFGVSPHRGDDVRMLSVGAMSSKFTVDAGRNRAGGLWDWGGLHPAKTPTKLFGLSISAQEAITNSMLVHQFPEERYVHLDDVLTDQRSNAVALDKADAAAREILLGSASETSKIFIGSSRFRSFMDYVPPKPIFYYGEQSKQMQGAQNAEVLQTV